jgi:WD40 repeat protein
LHPFALHQFFQTPAEACLWINLRGSAGMSSGVTTWKDSSARRRLYLVSMALLSGLIAFSVFSIHRELATCQSLDIWLGRSGCKSRILIPEFQQLTLQAMALPQGEQTVSLFGTDVRTDERKATMVRIALPGGEERGRVPLPAKHVTMLKLSADNTRAMLDCISLCDDKSGTVLVVSVKDGQTIGMLPSPSAALADAGKAEPPKSRIDNAVAVPGGKYLAKLSNDGKEIVIHAADDGRVIRAILSGRTDAPNSAFYVLQPSPSGRLIASLDSDSMGSLGGSGSIIGIWDIESGQKLATIQADDFYQGELLWSPDEKSIIVSLRTSSGGKAASALDIYDWMAKAPPAAAAPGRS